MAKTTSTRKPTGPQKKYSFSRVTRMYQEAINLRTDYEAEWKQVSLYLLPGRGIFSGFTRPKKRKLTNKSVINNVAEDALYILTSGMHGALTSPSRPWFRLEWENPQVRQVPPLRMWIEHTTNQLHQALHNSDFYSTINDFYTEYAGFGNGCIYAGEDTGSDTVPFRFEILTAGEYAYLLGPDQKPQFFFRTLFKSVRQIVEQFENPPPEFRARVERGDSGVDSPDYTVIEFVAPYPEMYLDKPFVRIVYLTGGSAFSTTAQAPHSDTSYQEPLQVDGFYELPYMPARWSTIGSDPYGIGPGARALPDIRRLQEMEKAFLMATHKNINPPLNVPGRMRGKTNTLPGGLNFYSNPNEKIEEIYQVRFDYSGVSAAVERVEARIQRNFFNDIFLTGARDPNATPYKATEVQAREQEKMLRMGPVVERLQFELFEPLIERCFNIMLRKGFFPPLPPEAETLLGDSGYEIHLVSPLATAQRSVALQGINSFMMFLGQAAQFKPDILDNLDADAAAREYADITGVQLGIQRPAEEVQKIRAERAQAQAQQAQAEQQAAQQQLQADAVLKEAQARKALAETAETQASAAETAQGVI